MNIGKTNTIANNNSVKSFRLCVNFKIVAIIVTATQVKIM